MILRPVWNGPKSNILHPLSSSVSFKSMHFRFIHTFPIYLCMSSLHSPLPSCTPHPITVIHHPSIIRHASSPWVAMATTSGPISLQPCSYWKEGSGSLRLSGGCGNWLGVSNHPTHTHAHTNSNTYAQIMQQNAQTFFFLFRTECYGQNSDLSANRFKFLWFGQTYWNSDCVKKRKWDFCVWIKTIQC